MKPTIQINWPFSIAASVAASSLLFLVLNLPNVVSLLAVAGLFWWLGSHQQAIKSHMKHLVSKLVDSWKNST